MAALRRDLACAALGLALAAVMWVAASRLPRSMLSDEFGADGLPRMLAAGLAAVCVLIGVRALLRHRRGTAGDADDAPTPLALHARAMGIIGLGFGYVLLAPLAGYFATAVLLLAATALYYGARPGVALAAFAAGGALVLWGTFAKLLGVSMPVGAWLAALAGLR